MEKGKRPDPTTNEKGKKKKERKGIKWNKGVLRSILFFIFEEKYSNV